MGTSIGMFVRNKDTRPHDYGEMSQVKHTYTHTHMHTCTHTHFCVSNES